MAEYRRITNLRGPEGQRGPIGETPDFIMGQVTTVDDNTEADARLRGTAENPILDLDIPRGIPGADVAPTDESVGAMVSTDGTDSNDAVRKQARREGRAVFSKDSGFRVLTVNQAGEPVLIHGDPDQISDASVASITKIMTCMVAMEVASRNNLSFAIRQTIIESDRNEPGSSAGNLLHAGDEVRMYDLIRCALIASDNVAPVALARLTGRRLRINEDGLSAGTAEQQYARCIQEMNHFASDNQEMGWRGASFSRPAGAGRLSPRQVCDLLWWGHSETNHVGPALNMESAEIDITGTDPRVETITGSSAAGSSNFPERLGYKGGFNSGRYHAAMLWEHPDTQDKYATVVLDVLPANPTSRHVALRDAIDATVTEGDYGTLYMGHTSRSGRIEDSTGVLDITDRFDGVSRTGEGGSGIYISRSGNLVQFTIVAVDGFDDSTHSSAIPTGFRPDPVAYGTTSPATQSTVERRVIVSQGGGVTIRHSSPGNVHRLSMTWVTDRVFPSTPYPGVPAKRA